MSQTQQQQLAAEVMEQIGSSLTVELTSVEEYVSKKTEAAFHDCFVRNESNVDRHTACVEEKVAKLELVTKTIPYKLDYIERSLGACIQNKSKETCAQEILSKFQSAFGQIRAQADKI